MYLYSICNFHTRPDTTMKYKYIYSIITRFLMFSLMRFTQTAYEIITYNHCHVQLQNQWLIIYINSKIFLSGYITNWVRIMYWYKVSYMWLSEKHFITSNCSVPIQYLIKKNTAHQYSMLPMTKQEPNWFTVFIILYVIGTCHIPLEPI